MTQPFSKESGRESIYRSAHWPGLTIELRADHLYVGGVGSLRTLSSAVCNGGLRESSAWVNWGVPLSYNCADPEGDARAALRRWGYDTAQAPVLLTAASLRRASVVEAERGGLTALCCTTAGVGNAARAGAPMSAQQREQAYRPGTINTMLLVDASLDDAALAGAFITAAEAKTAALQDLQIQSPANGRIATGTTTDALIIAARGPRPEQPLHRYAGTATVLGQTLAELVYDSVCEALAPLADA
ncbi:adenosylcobinamide amidohydrolase [Paenibacillus sp. IB182496]|uniref:Adenosylcobinamide amidohydrolase n=1 Tax=Paenibacillus sabuli TaxID=2772509 RepID=A0A927GSP4_9BACL|nr:adenosylcobinamide amidohydrolase [Paenibacillus sabuli]MBD2846783.1 adenosylcobinamide amidohydrolase [Paenibacillus sabuli]